jgi:hypothetical protein
VKINKVNLYVSKHNITNLKTILIHSYKSLIPGSIDGHGLYSSSDISCSSSNCRQQTTIIIGSILGGGIGIVLLLVGILFYCSRCKGRPAQTNLTFVNPTNDKTYKHDFCDITLFKSGIWSSRYFQFGMWHDFHHFTLLFNPQTSKISGSGSDNIGIFSMDGTYSLKTKRIGMIKTYQLGTGKRLDNSGYQMIIQVIWNSETRQFEGKWYVRTKKYRGENKFELKFNKYQQSPRCEKV